MPSCGRPTQGPTRSKGFGQDEQDRQDSNPTASAAHSILSILVILSKTSFGIPPARRFDPPSPAGYASLADGGGPFPDSAAAVHSGMAPYDHPERLDAAGLRIRVLQEDDLAFADELRAIAGWNQTLRDWRRFLALAPDGCFLAELDGRPVGTATTTRHAAAPHSFGDVAWIGMVLVHPDARRRGVGRALLLHALEHLRRTGVRWARLDATPDGEKVYRTLGFRADWPLARWERPGAMACGPLSTKHEARQEPEGTTKHTKHTKEDGSDLCGLRGDIPGFTARQLASLDSAAFGADRSTQFGHLLRDSRAAFSLSDSPDEAVRAYGLLRDGVRAAYLGPIVARIPADGVQLVHRLLDAAPGERVFWDIPEPNESARRCAENLGFTRQRPLLRMTLDLDPSADFGRSTSAATTIPDHPEHQWALAGPEVG